MPLTEEQLRIRLTGITGSEVAAVAGIHPYAGPIDVYRAKVEGHTLEQSDAMLLGDYLEDGVAKVYAKKTGAQLSETGTLVHPSIARVICTPDRIAKYADGATIDVSIKLPQTERSMSQWGEDGSDDIPDHYNAQVQWELLVLSARFDIHRAHVVAPIRGKLHVYNVLADNDAQMWLLERAQRFWRDHIETKTPPPLDGSESSTEWVRARYPKAATGNFLPGTPEADALMRQLFEARTRKKGAELECEMLTNRLIDIVKDAEGMTAPHWRISFRNTKDTAKTDWEMVAREMGANDATIRKYTRVSMGSRRFLPTWERPK